MQLTPIDIQIQVKRPTGPDRVAGDDSCAFDILEFTDQVPTTPYEDMQKPTVKLSIPAVSIEIPLDDAPAPDPSEPIAGDIHAVPETIESHVVQVQTPVTTTAPAATTGHLPQQIAGRDPATLTVPTRPAPTVQTTVAPDALSSPEGEIATERLAALDLPPPTPNKTVEHSAPAATRTVIASAGTDATLAQIRGQMTAVTLARDGTRAELRLDPPELGRVRISLEIVDGHVTAHLSPDRPEVLDLLRRHAETLSRDLLASGFDSAEMTFSEGHHPPAPATADFASDDEGATTVNLTLPTADDRLDLRL